MGSKKNNLRAILGTVVFHVLLLICFIFFGFSTPLPLPEEQGVEVNLGYSDDGTGEIEPVDNSSAEASSNNMSSSENDYSTQSDDESVNLNKTDNKTGNNNKEKEFTVNTNALYTGKNKNNGSQGITGNDGNQGKPGGNPNSNNYNGNAYAGKGSPSFKLSGRSSKSLPIPNYTLKDEGIVVVDIWVDKAGNVTKTAAGARGTTTTSQSLWKLAEDAAKRSKFDAKANAPEEQKGSITYTFINLN